MKEYIYKTLELFTGLLIGFVVYLIIRPTNEINYLLNIIIGLLTAIVVMLIIELSRLALNFENYNKKLQDVLDIINDKGKEIIFNQSILKYGILKFQRESIPKVWLNILWNFNKTYYSTSLISLDEGWNQAYTKLGLKIQQTKILLNQADIRRVFIIENTEELENAKNIILEQKQNGIYVKYIHSDEIKSKSILNTLSRKLKSMDFGIIDSDFVTLVYLNKKRIIVGGELVTNRSEIQNYKEFYHNLFEEAHELEV